MHGHPPPVFLSDVNPHGRLMSKPQYTGTVSILLACEQNELAQRIRASTTVLRAEEPADGIAACKLCPCRCP